MPAESGKIARHARASWRFTIAGMFFLTLAVAVTMAVFQARGGTLIEFPRAMMLGLSLLVVGGLLTQARELERTARPERPILPEVRTGYHFSACWRVAIVILLVAYHVIEMGSASDLARRHRSLHWWWIDLAYYLALVMIVASTRQVAGVWRRWSSPFFLLLAWMFSVVCFAVGLYQRSKLQSGGPPWAQPSFSLTICWTELLPLAFGSIYFVARGSASRWRRTLYASLFGFSLGASFLILLCNTQLYEAAFFPYLRPRERWHEGGVLALCWVAAPFLLMLGTAIAYRWTARESERDVAFAAEDVSSRTYLHENRIVLLALAASLAVDLVLLHWRAAKEVLRYSDRNSAFWLSLELAIPPLVTTLTVLHATLSRRGHSVGSQNPTWALSPWRFLGVWAAVTATTFIAFVTISLAGFSYFRSGMMR